MLATSPSPLDQPQFEDRNPFAIMKVNSVIRPLQAAELLQVIQKAELESEQEGKVRVRLFFNYLLRHFKLI